MEKNVKVFKTITVVLFIIAISLISFVGVFQSKLNSKHNIIPKLSYGMEIAGTREFNFTLDTSLEEKNVYVDSEGKIRGEVIEENTATEDGGISLDATVENEEKVAKEDVKKTEFATEKRIIKANDDSVLNKENFEKTKAIIQKRLETAQISEYNIRLDTVKGDLILEVPENDSTDLVYELAIEQGEFKIIDSQTGVILLDNSDVKKAAAIYSAEQGYQAFLQIEFTKAGAEKLKKISNEYIQITNEQDETETKYVELKFGSNTLLKTYFGEELSQGILQITLGQATTDYTEFLKSYESATYFSNILNSGKTPNVYSLASDNFVQSQVTDEAILGAKIIFAVLITLVSVVLIVKYKYKGILAAIASIGYIAITVLAIKYTKVIITLNSILAILGVVTVNYLFLFNFLNKQKTDSAKHAFLESMKGINITIIPLWIVAIIFTFMVNITISSVGMVMFWGLFVHVIYSFIITRTLYV